MAANRSPRANPSQVPPREKSQTPRFDPKAAHGPTPPRRPPRCSAPPRPAPRPACATVCASAAPLRPRSPSMGTHHQASTQSRNSATTPAASLSAKIPHTARVRPPLGRPRKLRASTRAAAGLCATSSIHVGAPGRAGSITWKRAASRTSLRPCATAAAGIVQTRIEFFEGGDGRRPRWRIARRPRAPAAAAAANSSGCRG